MTATQFLQELKDLELTRKEFLALIGRTAMNNVSYLEIKNNPDLSFEQLVSILENSPISTGDYVSLLNTARTRQSQKLLKNRRHELEERLENQLNSIVTGNVSPGTPAENVAEEILSPVLPLEEITQVDSELALAEIAITEVSEEHDTNLTPKFTKNSISSDSDEYGESDDFDNNAAYENLPRVIFCSSMAVTVIFLSFFLRYISTGEWGLQGLQNWIPQSYAEVFELQSTQRLYYFGGTYEQNTARTSTKPLFRAERFNRIQNPLAQNLSSETAFITVASEVYVFKANTNNENAIIQAIAINAGLFETAPTFSRTGGELLGIFVNEHKLYAIYSELRQTNLYFPETDSNNQNNGETFIFTQPQTVVYEFCALEFTGEPLHIYMFDGMFRELALNEHRGGFLIFADYMPRNNINPNEYDGFIPSYSENGNEMRYVPLRNIEFMRGSEYANMTVIGTFDGDGDFTINAVSGERPCWLETFQNSIIMGFYNERQNQTQLLRMGLMSGGGLSQITTTSWTNVRGRVELGFLDERAGLIRTVSVTRNGVSLYNFDTELQIVAPTINNIADGSGEIVGTAFTNSEVYVIAEQIYAIDTTMPHNPNFLNEISRLIADVSPPNQNNTGRSFYFWGEERYFEIRVMYDDGDLFNTNEESESEGHSRVRSGIQLIMYNSGTGIIEHTFTLPVPNRGWEEFTTVVSEYNRAAVAVSHDSTTGLGAIVVPVRYFNGVSWLESSFVLSYSKEYGFVVIGQIFLDLAEGVGINADIHTAFIRGGYVYVVSDGIIRSAAMDATAIAVYETNLHGS